MNGHDNAHGMSALTELNALRKEARLLGIEKPNTMRRDELKAAIAEAKANGKCACPYKSAHKSDCPMAPHTEGDPFDEINPELEGDHLPEATFEPDTFAEAKLDRDITREAWLLSAVEELTPLLAQHGATQVCTRDIRVSVGFPQGNVRKVVGQCHYAGHNNGVTHIFISPVKEDAVEMLGILAHELIHADDQGESGHSKHFREVAVALGLTGKMTATEVGEDLRPALEDISKNLGPYPHTQLNLGTTVKKQTTRMLKAECLVEDCECKGEDGKGYVVRLTAKWVAVGVPSCPGGSEMTLEEKD